MPITSWNHAEKNRININYNLRKFVDSSKEFECKKELSSNYFKGLLYNQLDIVAH